MSRDSFLERIRVDITANDNKENASNKPTEDTGESTDVSDAPDKGQLERSHTTGDKSSSNDSFLDSIAVKKSKTSETGPSHETSTPSLSENQSSQAGVTQGIGDGDGESSGESRGESSGSHGESSGICQGR